LTTPYYGITRFGMAAQKSSDRNVTLSLKLPNGMLQEMKRRATADDRTLSSYIRKLLGVRLHTAALAGKR